jgi:hypothetical protein
MIYWIAILVITEYVKVNIKHRFLGGRQNKIRNGSNKFKVIIFNFMIIYGNLNSLSYVCIFPQRYTFPYVWSQVYTNVYEVALRYVKKVVYCVQKHE